MGGVEPGLVRTLTSLKLLSHGGTRCDSRCTLERIEVGLPPRATYRSWVWGPMEGVLGSWVSLEKSGLPQE